MVFRKGTGGGHLTYAGGHVPLKKGTKAESQEIEKHIEAKFLKAIGGEEAPSVPLVKA